VLSMGQLDGLPQVVGDLRLIQPLERAQPATQFLPVRGEGYAQNVWLEGDEKRVSRRVCDLLAVESVEIPPLGLGEVGERDTLGRLDQCNVFPVLETPDEIELRRQHVPHRVDREV